MNLRIGCMSVVVSGIWAVLIGGCPNGTDQNAVIDATIAVSASRGPAPLLVSFSGESSTSQNGVITRFSWDFAGVGSAEGASAVFQFTSPGLYRVTLTVENENGDTAQDRVDVQVQGTSADAVIVANRTSGAAPLVVNFDGTQSSAVDDTIRDYYWDFGDGQTSRDSKPVHIFENSGDYSVTLRVISAGGVEDRATLSVSVSGAADSSLQFNGSQFATLPSGATGALSAFTFETFARPDNTGGTVVLFGNPAISLELSPSANLARLRVGAQTIDRTTAIAPNEWVFVAIAFDQASGLTVYLDTQAVLTADLTSDVNIGSLALGSGWRGNLARVRLWSILRDAADIATDATGSVSAADGELLGDWPIDDGSGQTLRNRVGGGAAGLRGTTAANEASDPAWSSDGP